MTRIFTQTSHTITEDGLTASTVQLQGEVPLKSDNNIVVVVANDNDVVTLAPVDGGLFQRVLNAGANILQIFPAAGDDLGNGIDNSTTLSPDDQRDFLGLDEVRWRNLTPTGIGQGVVVGPNSSSNNGIARFDGTTGKLIQDSFGTINDIGVLEIIRVQSKTLPSTSFGFIGMANADSIHWRNSNNTSDHTIGFPSDEFEIAVNGTFQYTFGATNANWFGNNLLGVGFVSSNATTPSTSGFIRMGNSETISWRNNASDGDLSLSVDASDNLIFAGVQIVTSLLTSDLDFSGNDALNIGFIGSNILPRAGTGFIRMAVTDNITWRNNGGVGDLSLSINGSDKLVFNGIELLTSATGLTSPLTVDLDFDGNDALQVGFITSNVTPVAGTGFLRMGVTDNITWRNNGGVGDLSLSINGSDKLVFNGIELLTSATGLTSPLTVDLDFDGNDAINVASIETDAALPALVGKIRLGITEAIAWRNPANDGEIQLLADTDNYLKLSGGKGIDLENNAIIRWNSDDGRRITNDSAGFIFDIKSNSNYDFKISDSDEYRYNATEANFLGNNLVNVGFIETNAATPSSIGTIRLGNSEIIAWRSGGNTTDVSFGYNVQDRFVFLESDRTVRIDFTANHTTPAVDDLIGQLAFKDDNSIGTTKTYAVITSNIINPLNGSERGSLTFDVIDGAGISTFFVLNEGDNDSIVFKKALDLEKIDAPPDPPIEEGRLFVSTVNGANNGLFVKIKQNNSIVEVQIA